MKASTKKAKPSTLLGKKASAKITHLQPDGEAPLWAAATPVDPVAELAARGIRTKIQMVRHYENLLDYHKQRSYADGAAAERKAQDAHIQPAKLEAVKAATALLQESSKMMSRAGYMMGKVLGHEGF